MTSRLLLALFALCLATTAHAQDMERDARAVAACRAPSDGVIVLTSVPQGPGVGVGETIRIRPIWTTYPGHQDEVRRRCFRNWQLSAGAPARLSANGEMHIAGNAVPGTTFTLSARYAGLVVQEQFEVVARVTSPLLGTWHPIAGTCSEATAIHGLTFASDGTFAVETVLYSHHNPTARGRWRTAGNRLILSDYRASDGNGGSASDFTPEATFTLENGVLRFDRPWHGSVSGHGTCNAPLRQTQ